MAAYLPVWRCSVQSSPWSLIMSMYLSTKNRSAATTLSPAVSDRYGAGPRSFGATLRIPGVETEKTAKKWRKNEQKRARYGLRKRV
eukprot:COSAG04_NODE_5463_length_1609_cov_9.307377_1_plen_85_part_10